MSEALRVVMTLALHQRGGSAWAGGAGVNVGCDRAFYCAVQPPSTVITDPFTILPASDAR